MRVTGNIYSTNVIDVLNGGAAQGMKMGSLVISSTYADTAPSNGLYVKGDASLGASLNVIGDITFNNSMLISAGSGTNIDHIWHDDSGAGSNEIVGTWHFNSDTSAKAMGNAGLRFGSFHASSSANSYLGGKLGIKNTSPSAELDVTGSIEASSNVTTRADLVTNSGALLVRQPNTTGGWARGMRMQTTDGATTKGEFGMYGSGLSSVYSMYMAHGTSPWTSGLGVYVTPDGKVGVGTDKTKTELTIGGMDIGVDSGGAMPAWVTNGNSRGISFIWGSDSAFIGMKNRGDGNANFKDTVIYFGDDPDDDLVFESQDGGEFLYFTGDAKVGYKKREPGTDIDINGDVRVTRIGVNAAPSTSYPLYVSGDTYITGWHRVSGTTGIYFQSYGGGWNMTDSTWIRGYGSKSLLIDGTIRTDVKLQIGSGSEFVVRAGDFNWKSGTIFSDTSGKVSINQASNSEHPLHVKSNGSYQGINIQRTALTDVSGLSWENSDGNYTAHIAAVDAGAGNTNINIYSGKSTSMSALTSNASFYNSGNFWTKGDILSGGRLMIRGDSGRTDSPAIDLAIGDSDTGFKWVSDGRFQMYANSSAVGDFTGSLIKFTRDLQTDGNLIVKGNNIYFSDNDSGANIIFTDSNTMAQSGFYSGADGFILQADNSPNNSLVKTGHVHATGAVYADDIIGTGKFGMQYNASEDSLDFVYVG